MPFARDRHPVRPFHVSVHAAALLSIALWAGVVLAQAPAAPVPPAKPVAPVSPAKPVIPAQRASATSSPAWSELTPTQQQSLRPLASTWSSLTEPHKRKWIALSRNYQTMPAPEQAKLHNRMTEWALLSPQQRAQARLNFAETKTLSPGDKQAQWEAYQALSPEERQKLSASAARKPAGAATAVKPVEPQKLATIPCVLSPHCLRPGTRSTRTRCCPALHRPSERHAHGPNCPACTG